MKLGLATCLLAAACYQPQAKDCAYACAAADRACPSGLTCDTQNMCRVPAMMGTACGEPPPDSGTGDARGQDAFQPDAGSACTWQNLARNFTVADFNDPPTLPDWDVAADTTYTIGASLPGGVVVRDTGGTSTQQPAYLVHVQNFIVEAGVTLTIEGHQPIIIAAEQISIHGTVRADNGEALDQAPTGCTAAAGAPGCITPEPQGGGGGGYGTAGAAGGGAATPSNGGMALDTSTDSPLHGGCPGGHGGNGVATDGAGTMNGGTAGRGGGAIQLSARTHFYLDGKLVAAGEGGGPGSSDNSGANHCGNALHGRSSGGGGGGAGGLIVIDACDTAIAGAATLCATGGGGGGGGGGGTTGASTKGLDGECLAPAPGGTGEKNNGGGDGGFDTTAPGPGAIATYSGGGGGGAVGTIRVHQLPQTGAPSIAAGARFHPAPTAKQ